MIAKSYTQKEEINFQEIYSPVAKFASIKIILAIVAHLNLKLHQMDVTIAFFNGDFQKDIYMCLSEGFQVEGHEGKVCKLNKSMYGLK